MKRHLISTITLIYFCINHLIAQNEEYLAKLNKTEAQELLVTLKDYDIRSNDFRHALERAINNYASFQHYAQNEANEIFDFILKETRPFKNEYYRFLSHNVEYFSDSQTEFIKTDLARVLDKSDYQFYDIVALYHLDNYKPIIAREVDTAYFRKLRTAFMQKTIPVGLLEKARPIIALANLGEVSMEDSIINLVDEFYFRCINIADSLAKKNHYIDLYFGVVPKILGKLNSRRSFEETAKLMFDDFVFFENGSHEAHPMYAPYITYVVLPKISRHDQAVIEMNMAKILNGTLTKKDFVDTFVFQVKNNSIKWKKTLNDVDK